MPITKRLRLSIDFIVEIAGEPPLLPDGVVEPPDEEYDGRQARLLEAVKGNQEVLQNWLKSLVMTKMQAYKYKWDEFDEEAIIAPAIASLSEEDRDYFDDMKEIGMFYEASDMFQASFIVTEEPPVISEIESEIE